MQTCVEGKKDLSLAYSMTFHNWKSAKKELIAQLSYIPKKMTLAYQELKGSKQGCFILNSKISWEGNNL